MNKIALVLVAMLTLTLSPSASAGCETDSDAISVADAAYVVDGGDWVYVETNGEAGVQRGGVAWHGNDAEAVAYDCDNPDMIIY